MFNTDLYKAVEALKSGEVVVYPTDTLYALGGIIYNENAVKKVFNVKKRPLSNPLSIALSGINQLDEVGVLNKNVRILAENFLPGSLTLVLKKRKKVPRFVTGQLDKVAVRIPDNKIALELISQTGPLTVTSANIHGMETKHTIKDIKNQINNKVAFYLDDGLLDGLPSTIVDTTFDNPKIIRKGSITEKQILDVI